MIPFPSDPILDAIEREAGMVAVPPPFNPNPAIDSGAEGDRTLFPPREVVPVEVVVEILRSKLWVCGGREKRSEKKHITFYLFYRYARKRTVKGGIRIMRQKMNERRREPIRNI